MNESLSVPANDDVMLASLFLATSTYPPANR